MQSTTLLEPARDIRTGAVAAAILVPTLLATTPAWLAAAAARGTLAGGDPLAIWRTIGWQLATLVFWAGAAPVVIGLARRRAPERHVALHALLAFGAALAHAALLSGSNAVLWIPAGPGGTTRLFARALGAYLPFDLLVWATLLLVASGIAARRRQLESEARAARIEADLERSRLRALRLQLEPHFLFNALNAAIVLVRRPDPRAAAAVLTGLSDLLREVLASAETRERPLGDEVRFLERYLDIERVRFSDRLATSIDVDAQGRAGLVPTLVLQPLVENAVRHGIGRREQPGGIIEVVGRREGDRLIVRVRDNGPGLEPGWNTRERPGLGLANVRARLAAIGEGGGDGGHLVVAEAAGGGVVAAIDLPYRSGEAGTAGEVA